MHIAFARPTLDETGGDRAADYINGLAPALLQLGHQVEIIEGGIPPFSEGVVPVIDAMMLPGLHGPLNTLLAHDAVALVHGIAASDGSAEAASAETQEIERRMLPRLRRVIATDATVAARLRSEFGVAVQEVLPGVDDLPRTEPAAGQTVVLAVGALTRRDGQDALLRAMARLTDLDWTLVVAGSTRGQAAYAAELLALIDELGLSRRATLLPDPEFGALERAWQSAGLFALATQRGGYAAALAEALRRGIPAVVTDVGGAAALIPAEAGVVCSVHDPATFGKCLRRLLFDDALRADMAENAWRAGQKLPGWNEQAQRFATILRS